MGERAAAPAESTAADLLSRALALTGHYEAVVTDGQPPAAGGWIRYRHLTAPAGLRRLADHAAEYAAGYGGFPTVRERAAAAALAVGSVASALAFAVTGVLCLAERALRLDPDGLAFRLGGGGVDALAVPARGVATTSDGCAAEHGAASEYTSLLAPVLADAGRLTRRGRRALGVDAADRLVTALFRNSQVLGRLDAPARAQLLVAGMPASMRHQIRLMDVPCGDGIVTWKRRAVCCLAYQTPPSAGQYCITCPLISIEESSHRVSTWLGTLTH